MAALVQAVRNYFQREPVLRGAVIAIRAQRSITLAMVGLLALPALCMASPPPMPAQAAELVKVADTIVIGRVIAVANHSAMRSAIVDWVASDMTLDIAVDRVLASPAPLSAPFIRVSAHASMDGEEKSYGIFFLHRESDGSFSNAQNYHWFLAAKQMSGTRNAPAESPLLAVEREILEILATPPDRVLAPGTGAYWYTEPTQEAIDQTYAAASTALHRGLEPEIRAGLRALTHGNQQVTRLWAAATLFENEDADELATVVPDLMDPPPEAHRAAVNAGFELRHLEFAAGTDLLSFVTLLHSQEAAVRSGAVEALRQGSREGHVSIAAVVDPLIDAIEAKSDLETPILETEAICQILEIRDRPCPDLPFFTQRTDILPHLKTWAQAQRR